MEKKTVWLALGGGFIAGLVAGVLMCTMCCAWSYKHKPMQVFPARLEMMQHKMHHKGAHMGFHQFREPTPEMKEHFAKKLGLSEEQKATLEQYRQEDMVKMKPLFDEMDKLHAKIKDLRKANRARFESVLTDAQKEILQQMKAKHHGHKANKRHPVAADDNIKAKAGDDADVQKAQDEPLATPTLGEVKATEAVDAVEALAE